MPTDDHRRITPQTVRRFADDGVVLLRQAVDASWIETLRAGVDKNINAPTERGRVWDRDEQGHACLYDSQVWREVGEYRDFIQQSPIAEIAARLLNTDRVNFFFDAIFVRTPGAQFRTPFHQDEPYWSVEGFDICSIWMPLVAVEKKSALEFVRGSHRWPKMRQINFGALAGDPRDQHIATDGEPFPDIDGARDQYDLVGWDMAPGDAVAFNGRTIHGGGGNLAAGRELKVFSTKWLGDDVRVCFREEGMDPDHSQVMTAAGLKPGDRVGTELYPEFRFNSI